GSESRPPMLNKENYVPWSSRLLRYAKSRPNGKLIHNSILNGPYVRRMIPEPGDANREVTMTETFHVQTDDELSDKELNCETAQEIWLQVQQMMKGSDIGIQGKKAKLFNKWERFTFNERKSIESYYHCFLKLMNDLKRNKHFPEKIANDKLSERELKQIKANDQAIQTILLGLPEDIYAAVDSCETAQEIWLRTILLGLPEDIYAAVDSCKTTQEIWLRVQQMMKGSNIGIQEKKANRHVTIVHQTKDLHTADYTQFYDFLKYNQKEIDELKAERLAKTQDPLALMANFNNPYVFTTPHQDQSSFNQNYLQQPMPNPEDITDPTTAMNMALSLMAKAFKLNYSTPTNNNQRISSNLRNKQIAQPGMNMDQDRKIQMVGGNGGNQFRQYAGQNAGNPVGWANENQIRCYNCRGVEEYDLMATAADLDEIEEVSANCILMANLQQASTSGTQTDKALVYDSDGSAEKLKNENVELKFQVLNYAREIAHLKATYKNLFDFISVSQTQTKTIITSLQNELQSTIYKNAKLRTQLFKKVSDQKDNTHDRSENTKFAKQPIMENLPKVGESHALSKPVTSNLVSTPQESIGVKNDKVIAPGMFRINPFKTSREETHLPNTVRASTMLALKSQTSMSSVLEIISLNGFVL
nr:hypothetical protein [Tanacetum cinerariifolium]